MADPNPFDLARSKKTITEEERKKKNLARMNAERAARAEAAAADAVLEDPETIVAPDATDEIVSGGVFDMARELREEPIVEGPSIFDAPGGGRYAGGQKNLAGAKDAFIEGRSTDIEGRYDPEAAAEARDLLQKTEEIPTTITGEPAVATYWAYNQLDNLIESNPDDPVYKDIKTYLDNPDLKREGIAGTMAGLLPQKYAIGEQAKAYLASEKKAEDAARSQMSYGLYELAKTQTDPALKDLYNQQADQLGSGRDVADFGKKIDLRKQQILSGEVSDLTTYGFGPSGTIPESSIIASGIELAKDVGTRKTADDIVESKLIYGARLLGAPVSAGVGAIEGLVTDKPIDEAVASRVTDSMGVMGAGIDISTILADELDEPQTIVGEVADWIYGDLSEDEKAYRRNRLAVSIGGAGLAGDFMLPIVPGLSAVKGATSGAIKGIKVAEALGDTGSVLRAAGEGAAVGGLAGARDAGIAGKFTADMAEKAAGKAGYELPSSIRVGAIERFAANPANQDLASLSIRFMQAAEDSGTVVDDLVEAEALYKRLAADSFSDPLPYADFINAAGAKGFKLTDPEYVKGFQSSYDKIVYRAALDQALSPELKTQLILSGGASNAKLASELETYFLKLLDSGMEKADIEALAAMAPKAIRENLESFGLAAPRLTDVKPALNAITEDSVVRQVLYKNGLELAEESQSVLFPTLGSYTKMTAKSFLPEQEGKRLISYVMGKNIDGTYNTALGKVLSLGKGGRAPPMEGATIVIPDDIAPLVAREIRMALANSRGQAPVEALAAKASSGTLGNGRFTTKEFNEAVEAIIDSYASARPGYMNMADVTAVAKKRKASGGILKSNLAVQDLYSKVLTPKAIADGFSVRTMKGIGRGFEDLADPKAINPEAQEFIDLIGTRWGGMYEDFKIVFKRNRSEVLPDGSKLSPPEAFTKTLAQNYVRGYDQLANAPKEMFIDYVTIVFGGNESLAQVLRTSDSSKVLSALKAEPAEIRQLAFLISETADYKPLMSKFVDAYNNGSWDEVILGLRELHVNLSQKKLSELLSVDEIAGLKAEAQANTGIVLKSDRALKEILTKAGSQGIAYLPENMMQVLSAQYLSRRQAQIISEGMEEMARRHPGFMPGKKEVKELIDGFDTRVIAYVRDYKNVNDFGFSKFDTLGNLTKYADSINPSVLKDKPAKLETEIIRIIMSDRRAKTAIYEDLVTRALMPGGTSSGMQNIIDAIPGLKGLDSFFSSSVSRADKANIINGIAGDLLSSDPAAAGLLFRLSYVDSFLLPSSPGTLFHMAPESNKKVLEAFQFALRRNAQYMAEGPMAAIQSIKRAYPEIAKGLQGKVGDAQFTETMASFAILDKADKAAGVLTDGIYTPVQNRLLRDFFKAFEMQKSSDAFNELASFAKGGVLGGQFLPGLRFLMTNWLTAPAIVYSTLGPKYAAKALKTAVLGDFDTNRVMKYLHSIVTPNKVGGARGIPDEVVLFTQPSGRVYTNKAIAELISTSSIMRSQASAEMTTNIIKDMLSWSSVNADELVRKGILKDTGFARKQIQQYFGGPLGGRQMNIWSEVGNQTDVMFRTSVLIEALKKGATEADALRLAREALFDYGNLSSFEKNVIQKVLWFWTFRRNNLLTFSKNMIQNPERIKNTYLVTKLLEGDNESHVATKEYAESRMFVKLIEDEELKQRYSIYGPSIPLLEGMAEMLDYLSIGVLLLNPSLTNREKLGSTLESVKNVGIESARPGVATAVGLTFGIDTQREGRDIGGYLDPKLMWYLQQNPEMWETFSSIVHVEAVPLDQEYAGSGTYQGRQWRIVKGDEFSIRTWFAIEQLLLQTGTLRMLRDYVPLLDQVVGDEDDGDVKPMQMAEPFWNTVGVVTPISEPSMVEQKANIERSEAYELKRRAKK